MNEIDVPTLQSWLANHRPVVVLDVRTGEDRAQWSIPGSRHVNAYDDLKAGRRGPLDDVSLPAGVPVVTVCNLGKTSAIAAAKLRDRGVEAQSLRGGMQAWSLAWNTADTGAATARVVQVRRTGKGCLSYIVASDGVAAVVDPSLPAEVYIALAAQHGWRIEAVLETHIHADHLSRARALAGQTGARLLLPEQKRIAFPFVPLSGGDTIPVGGATLRAIRTPGHTLESTCFALGTEAVFTGDTLFLASVGRPDLSASAEEARQRAKMLYGSLLRLRSLPDDVLVLPGHASQGIAFDGKPVAGRAGEIFGRLTDWFGSEQEFLDRVLAGIPEPPPNHLRIVEMNEAGEPLPEDPGELEAGANRCAVG
jgi:glyoxylase-like metal-dependent hydrolase (beta-lactamase superfamily II)/rhodanese-related sulfurtransferase